jgi:uncharacterized membrane protein YfcA
MGGGALLTPLLVLFFGFKPTLAIGTDILHGAIFKSVGAVRHRRLGTVSLRLTAWMLLGSAPLSLAGVWVADLLENRYGDGLQTTQKQILGAALVACGVGFLVKSFLRARPSRAVTMRTRRERAVAVAIGLAGGFVVGLTSVGSGTFFALAVMLAFPLAASAVVGTDIFHAALLLWVAGAGHVVGGNVDWGATGWLLIGSIPGVLAGSHVTVRLPDRALRVALATTLAVTGVKLVGAPDALMLAPVAVGVLALAAAARRRVPSPKAVAARPPL